jgi:GT2 family glycosyltransferase
VADLGPGAPRDAADVTFVVLNWNGRSFLEVVLPSIFAQRLEGFAVHVVDDASTDDSREYVQREWPAVEFFAHADNVGLTANMRRAIATATTPYIAVLNNDLELDPDWLSQMRSALERSPHAAAADCRMIDYYDRSRLDGAGDLLNMAMLPGRRGSGEPNDGRFGEPEEVFSVSLGAALMRRSAYLDVGELDADLFAYYEDIDWGFRARLRGWSAIYVPAALAYHMGSATMNAKPGRWSHLFPRNQIYVVVKNLPGRLALRYLPRIVVSELVWLRTDMRAGAGAKHLKGWWQALRMLPLALRRRREVQRTRRVGDAVIAAALTPVPGVLASLRARLRGRS